MDDHLDGMHNWNWNHRSDEKYCDGAGYPMPYDNDAGEGYVDSLRQLNRIVERILPESSSPAVVLTRQKLELSSSLKRPLTSDYSDNACSASSKRQQNSRTSDVSFYDNFNKKSCLNHRIHCDSARDSMAIKRERGNDSLNDSAYETFFDDGSIENGDGNCVPRETVSPDGADTMCSPRSRVSETGSKFSSPVAETAKAEEGRCIDTSTKVNSVQPRESFRQSRCSFSLDKSQVSKSKSKQEDAGVSAVGRKHSEITIKASTLQKKKEASSFFESPLNVNKPNASADTKLSKNCVSNPDSSADDPLDSVACHSDWSPAEQLKICQESAGEDDCLDDTDSSVQASTPGTSRNYAEKTHGTNRYLPSKVVIKTTLQEQQQTTSREAPRLTGDEELKSFTCPHCAYSASKKGQVRKHMSVHGIFLCAHCEFSCERVELLEEHRRLHHPGLCGRRLCKKCRILFPSSELDKHERQCSGEKQRWACPECGKEFKFLSVMKAHAHKWHPHDGDGDLIPSTTSLVPKGGVTEGCDEPMDKQDSEVQEPCENQTMSSSCKSVSVAVPSSTEKIYQCEECGKSFKTKWTLSNHAMLTHGANTPFCCDIDGCKGLPFRSDKELNCHRQTVHQLGPRKYECQHPGCTMQFAKYGHFKRHQSTHTGMMTSGEGGSNTASSSSELKFKCDWPSCTKSFIHQDYLQVHYRRHTDEKPYRCHHCDATYRQKSGLKYHLDKVHNEKTVGRSGRKRKVNIDSEVNEAMKNTDKVDKSATDVKEAEAVCGSTGVDEQGGLFHRARDDCHPATVGDSIRQKLRENVTAMQKSKEGLLAKLQVGLKTKHSGLADKTRVGFNEKISWPSEDAEEDIKWSSNDVCTSDDREDLGNMGLDDDWMLDNDDDDRKNEELRFSRNGFSQRSESGDRDQVGSTSDTEPLDEDLCEELRKLTDVINGADLSPRGIESRPTTYGSPDAVESFVDTADGSMPLIEGVASNLATHDVPYHNEMLQRETNLNDVRQTYDKFSSSHVFSDVNTMQCTMYTRCQSEDDVEDLNAESEPSPSDDMVTHSRPVVLPGGFGRNVVNTDYVAGEYYTGTENKSSNCFVNNRMQYGSPIDASGACPASRLRSVTSNDGGIDTSIRPSDIDMPGQSWPATNPYWPVRAADSMSSMSGHSSMSNPVAPVCSSVGPEYVEHLCRQEDGYITSEAHWSSADGDHRWTLHDELVRGWCDSSQPPVSSHPSLEPPAEQTVLEYSGEPNVHWHMGRQGESAFTPSRVMSGSAGAMGFDVVGRQTSPSVGPQYRGNSVDLCSVQGRVADSLGVRHPDGYMSGAPDSSWSGFYGRPGSTSSCVDGIYDQYLARDAVYKPSLPPERLYLPPPGQMGVIGGGLPTRSSVDYGHNMAMTRQPGGAYGLGSNGYALSQMHSASPWSESDYSDDIECRRPLSDVGGHHHRMPYQQNSMLYNVVPRYY